MLWLRNVADCQAQISWRQHWDPSISAGDFLGHLGSISAKLKNNWPEKLTLIHQPKSLHLYLKLVFQLTFTVQRPSLCFPFFFFLSFETQEMELTSSMWLYQNTWTLPIRAESRLHSASADTFPPLCISVRLYVNQLSPQLLFVDRLDSKDSGRFLTPKVDPGMDYLLEFLAYKRNDHRRTQQCDGELEAEPGNHLIIPFR